MNIKGLLEQQTFLKLLDENDSKEMTSYLSTLRSQEEINIDTYRDLTKMFKDLDIYQDVYMYYREPLDEKIKYIARGSILFRTDKTLDLRNKVLASYAVTGPNDCILLVDSTTKRLDDEVGKWSTPIDIKLQDHNEIQIDSLPDGLMFLFEAQRDTLEINTIFKVNKNITNFKEFLEKQTISAMHPKNTVIDAILTNTEVI